MRRRLEPVLDRLIICDELLLDFLLNLRNAGSPSTIIFSIVEVSKKEQPLSFPETNCPF